MITKIYSDFQSFAEVEAFAKEHSGEIVALRKKDGARPWEVVGAVDEPFNIAAFIIGDQKSRSINIISDDEDLKRYKEFCQEILDDLVEDGEKMNAEDDELYKSVAKAYETMEQGEEFLCVFNDTGEIETHKLHDIHYRHDVYTWRIGVRAEEE